MTTRRSRLALAAVGTLVAATVVAGPFTAPTPAHADVEPVNPVMVDLDGHAANSGFLVFVEGNVFLNADETEGTIAVGGDLSFGRTYQVAAGGAPVVPTYTVPGDARPTYLHVDGGIDFSRSDAVDIVLVQNQGFTKIADTSTYTARDVDMNTVPILYRVVPPGLPAETIPRIQGTAFQTPVNIGTPVSSSLIDIPGAFAVYRGLSTELGTCQSTVVLRDDAGNPMVSPFPQGSRAHVTLVPNQTNVLTISAQDLDALGELQYDTPATAISPLLVNVTGTSFTGTIPNQPGGGSAVARYVLYNFADATSILVNGGDSLYGTIYAPRANLQWQVTQNIEGNVIASEFTHGNSNLLGVDVREVHDFPFNAELSCVTPAATAALTLVKTVAGGAASPGDWDLTATGPTTITGPSGDPLVTNAVVGAGDYTLLESGGPADYTPSDWICTGATLVGDVVTLEVGDVATCTITNTFDPPDPPDPQLTLVKVVDGGAAGPGDWTLSADGPTPISGPSGDPLVTDAVVDAGDYTLSESGGPADYAPSDWTCTGAILVGDVVTLEPGDDVTCTITNTFAFRDPKLTLVKVVDGGTASPQDWTLSADGTTPISGASGSSAVTVVEVLPGDYLLSEADGPVDYDPSDWVCDGGIQTGSTVTVDWGDSVVCTITNTFTGSVLGEGEVASGDLSATGTDLARPLGVSGAALLLGGLMLIGTSRLRRRA